MSAINAEQNRGRVEAFTRKHRIALLTMLFTDIVGSTRLKQVLGDRAAIELIQRHHALIRELIARFPEAEEIDTAGDSFFIVFAKPSDAAHCALLMQNGMRRLREETGQPVLDRIGIHVGEVFIQERGETRRDLFGIQIDTTARVMSLGGADQILLSRFAFDSARQILRGFEIPEIGELTWLNHGYYEMKGVEQPLEVCEVGETKFAALTPPKDSEKAHRFHSPTDEPVLGWRPAAGQVVPHTRWTLERSLGEGGFGEVWLARHEQLKQARVIKFCFNAERARSLKREVTLFRLLRKRVGEHPNIVAIHDVFFDEPPFYIVMDFVDGPPFDRWSTGDSAAAGPMLETRLEVLAQVADALQAAHDSEIIHRDVKPSNILVPEQNGAARAKLTDFGIGRIINVEALAGVTGQGFTHTLDSSSSRTGTRNYMAPELLAGEPATTRSDIYSLGVILWQTVTEDFTRPLTGDWPETVADPLLREDIRQCVAGDPQKRFVGVAQLAARLRTLGDRRTAHEAEQQRIAALERRAYRRGLIRAAAGAAAILAVIALLAVYAFREAGRANRESAEAQSANAKNLKLLHEASMADLAIAIQRIERDDKWREGVAHLARALEWEPTNRLAALRLYETIANHGHSKGNWPELLLPHDAEVSVVKWSPDGARIATASADGTVRLWDATTGKLIGEPLPHEADVRNLEWSPDSTRIATSLWYNDTIRIWNVASGRPAIEPMKHEGRYEVYSLEWSPDGRRIVTASENARVWDAATGKRIFQLAHAGRVDYAKWSPDGTRIVTASHDRTARVWDAATGKPVTEPLAHKDGLWWADWSPDSCRIVTLSRDGAARIWDAVTGKTLGEPLRDENNTDVSYCHVKWSADGTRIITTAGAGRMWDLSTGKPIGEQHDGGDTAQWSSDGMRVVTRGGAIWDGTTGRRIGEPLFGGDGRGRADWSPDCGRIVTTWGKFAVISHAAIGQLMGEPLSDTDGISRAGWSPDSTRILTRKGKTARIREAATGNVIGEAMRHEDVIQNAEWSPDGRRILTAGDDNTARIWDAASGNPLGQPLRHTDAVFSAQWNPDGRRIATAIWDGTVHIWDAGTGKTVGEALRAHDRTRDRLERRSAHWSPDGTRILTWAWNENTARVWDAATRKLLVEPHPARGGAKWSPDGIYIATTGWNQRTAHIWDTRTRQEFGEPLQEDHSIGDMYWSPDGTRILTDAGTIWKIATRTRVAGLHELSLERLQWDSEGARIVSSDYSGTARVWEAATGKAVCDPLEHPGRVGAQWSPDGSRVLLVWWDGTLDGNARIWHISNGNRLPAETPRAALDVARAVAGYRFAPDGDLVVLEPAERLSILASALDASDDLWGELFHWLALSRERRTTHPRSTRTLRQIAEQERDAGTSASLASALLYDPTIPLARLLSAEFENNPQRAAFLREYDLRRMPEDPDLRERASRSLAKQKEAAAALDAAQNSAGTQRARAKAYIASKQHAEAVAAYEPLLSSRAASADDFGEAAYQAALAGAADKAREIFALADDRFPGAPRVAREKGWALLHFGDAAGAVNAFEAALTSHAAVESGDRIDLLAGLAAARWAAGRRDGAIATFRDLIAAAPGWAEPKHIYQQEWPEAETKPLLEVQAETLRRHPELARERRENEVVRSKDNGF